jgi:membrane-associated HD superfamily phosphohydrolase
MVVFNGWYYSWAPVAAHVAQANHIFSEILQVILFPLFGILLLSSDAYFAAAWFSPEAGATIAGMVAALLIGTFYMAPVAYAFTQALRPKRRATTVLLKPLALCIALSSMLVGAAIMINSSLIMAFATLSLTLSAFTLGGIFGVKAIGCTVHSMIDWKAARTWFSRRFAIRIRNRS